MKLKINGEYANVAYWSFIKCYIVGYVTLVAISFAVLFVLAFLYTSGYF